MVVTAKQIRDRLNLETKKLKSRWLTDSQIQAQLRTRLGKSWDAGSVKKILKWWDKQQNFIQTVWNKTKATDSPVSKWKTEVTWIPGVTWSAKIKSERGIIDVWPTNTNVITETETVTETPEVTPTETLEQKTLRERLTGKVAWRIAWRKTEEQKLIAAREEAWRQELVDLQKGFREEAWAVQEDIRNISEWLKAEGWAITNIAASRIREARSAPLREQLTSLVRWQELTSANLKELDTSIDAILEAREIDRQNEVANLTNQIEWSNLSSAEKNKLLTQLGQQTARMKQESEIEAFKQKEEIKANIEQKEQDSLNQTGLSLWQNITLGKITNNFWVKDDSLVGRSIAWMLKEWKTEQEINKILWLATDAEGNFVDDTQFARREKLRKEFEAKSWVKTYREAVLQHQWTISTLWQASWPWDVAAVFQFMKTLDPTSVVRESEFEAAANAAWVTEKIDVWNLFAKFKNWAILWEKDSETRKAFVETVNELFKVKKQNFDWLARQMIQQAIRDWVDPKSVVLDLDEVPGASDLTRDDFNLLEDDDLLEIDSLYWFNTSDWTSFNITGLDKGEITSWTNITTKEEFIKSKEWFREKAYLDSAWVPTIWYGFTSFNWKPVKLWQTITKWQAEREFDDQIARHSNYKNLVTVPLSEKQKIALASFEFNLWPNIWKSTWKDIIKAINKWDIETAKKIILKHNKARNPNTKKLEVIKWLTNRRVEEADLLEMIS